MKVLITGATGYIGSKLLEQLVASGHAVVACKRCESKLPLPQKMRSKVEEIQIDLLDPKSLQAIPSDIQAAYYLVHSMKGSASGFADLERQCAENFISAIKNTSAKQIIFLSGLSEDPTVSEHLTSRRQVEHILKTSKIPVTILRAGIIVGRGSASFQMIQDLVEKLPVMIGPKWVLSKCQPIALSDVLFYLVAVLGHSEVNDKTFEIGGPDQLTYRDMLLQYAKARRLKRWMLTVPFLTPTLSSLWLFFVTSANFSLARALVRSLKTDAVVQEHSINEVIPHVCLTYEDAIRKSFQS